MTIACHVLTVFLVGLYVVAPLPVATGFNLVYSPPHQHLMSKHDAGTQAVLHKW